MSDYNPDTQAVICGNRDLCYFGEFPTLATVNRKYGVGTANAWLIPQIANLSEFCGCKEKITPIQIKECASIIANEYYFLKVSELMLFFYLFKAGRYGKFYGNVDPMVITCSLRQFLTDRSDAIFHHDSEVRRLQEEKEHGKGISYEEYKRNMANGKYPNLAKIAKNASESPKKD